MGWLGHRRREQDETSHEQVFEMFAETDDQDENDEALVEDSAVEESDYNDDQPRPHRFKGFRPGEKIAMGVAGLVCAVSLGAAVHAVSVDSAQVADDQAQIEVAQAHSDRDAALDRLDEAHGQVLGELEGYDEDRVSADESQGRSLITALSGSLGSTNGTKTSAQLLDQSYPGLDTDSQLFTQFWPQLVQATARTPQQGQDPILYQIDRLQVLPVESETSSDEKDDERTYLLMAELQQVGADDEEASAQYVLMRYTTDEDGRIVEASAQLAAQDTAQRLSTND